MWTLLGVCRPQGSIFELKFHSQGSILGQISVANCLIFLRSLRSQGHIFSRLWSNWTIFQTKKQDFGLQQKIIPIRTTTKAKLVLELCSGTNWCPLV